MNLGFAWPLCFLLFVPFALAAWRMLRRGKRTGMKFAPLGRLPAKTAGWRAHVAGLAPWLFLAGAALLVVAAARPRTSQGESRVESKDVIAIAMALDVSGSMAALDFAPDPAAENAKTRLDVVKDMFSTFVEARTNDLVGFVAFCGYVKDKPRAPLTANHKSLQSTIMEVKLPFHGANLRIVNNPFGPQYKVDGYYDENNNQLEDFDPDDTNTAIGDGLMGAIDCVKDANVKSKVVILLSDGVSNTGAVEPDTAAEAAASLGIRVYTIGVGTRSRRAPLRRRYHVGGRELSEIVYDDMTFDEKQLKSIAAKTGARYFSVNDEDGLKKALDDIDKLEKTTIESSVYQRWREYFPWFLLPGTFLVLLAVSLQISASRRLV